MFIMYICIIFISIQYIYIAMHLFRRLDVSTREPLTSVNNYAASITRVHP